MGIFTAYKSNPFSNLANVPQTIITATTSSWIQAIIITNLGEEEIGINLKFKSISGTGTTEIFLVKNFGIPSFRNPIAYKDKTLFNTVDLVDILGIPKNLQFAVSPPLTESLICYSNGYSQQFDCCVEYTQLNSTP